MIQPKVLKIVVASPSDVQAERDIVEDVVADLNRGVAHAYGLRLEVARWETDAYPGFHPEGPQGLIDSTLRIEETCDILIGIFWTRFGTPTTDARSGTEHEIRNAYETWKREGRPQIMVYFNYKAYAPEKAEELDQWRLVIQFREEFPQEGLWWPYEGSRDFGKLIRNHLTNFLRDRYGNRPPPPPPPKDDEEQLAELRRRFLQAVELHALLRVKYDLDRFLAAQPLHSEAKILASKIDHAIKIKEAEEFAALRARLPLAKTTRELRRLMFEVDQFLIAWPNHAAARVLKEDTERAMAGWRVVTRYVIEHKKLITSVTTSLIAFFILLSIPVSPDRNMVQIPAGTYPVGLDVNTPYFAYLKGALDRYTDNIGPLVSEKARRVGVRGYYIDRYEVTNAQYQQFLNFFAINRHDSCRHEPRGLDHLPLFRRRIDRVEEGVVQGISLRTLLDDERPVVGVTYYDAAAYCTWAGKKLPTVEQWEVTLRADQDSTMLYYWDSEWRPELVHTEESIKNDLTLTVNDPRVGMTPKGVFGMVGNAAEWLWKEPDSTYTYLIQSSFLNSGEFFGASHARVRYEEEYLLDSLSATRLLLGSGFRCAFAEGEDRGASPNDMVYFAPGTRTLGVEPTSPLLRAMQNNDLLRKDNADHNLKLIFDRSKPAAKRELNAFWMDRYEVSNREYDVFLEWVRQQGHGRCIAHPPNKDHQPEDYRREDPLLSHPDHPVVGVDWIDAMSYAQWKGKRLPYWYEWEVAVGGLKGHVYPWGNIFDAAHVNDYYNRPRGRNSTMRVDTLKQGASPQGIYHLVGNVMEWMADGLEEAGEDEYYVKGSHYSSNAVDYYGLRYYTRSLRPTGRSKFLGFRCVSDKKVSLISRLLGKID